MARIYNTKLVSSVLICNVSSLTVSGCVDIPLESSVIERACFSTPPTQDATIYLSEPGVYTKLAGQVGGGADTLDMLSVALKINLDTFRNVKVRASYSCVTIVRKLIGMDNSKNETV